MPVLARRSINRIARAQPRQRIVMDDMSGWTSGTGDSAVYAPTGPLGPWLKKPDGTLFAGYSTSRKRTTSGTTIGNFSRTYGTPMDFSDGNMGFWLRTSDPRSYAESCTSTHYIAVSSDAFGSTGASISFQSFSVTTRTGTCTTTNGSPTVTVSSSTGLSSGMKFMAAGIPALTTITGVSGTTVTLSANATASGTGVAFTSTLGNTTGDVMMNQPNRWFFLEFPSRLGIAGTDEPAGGVPGLWTVWPGKSAPDFSAINWVRLASGAAANGMENTNAFTVWLGGIEKVAKPSQPVFSILWDRYSSNLYDVALPVLASKGVRCTVRGDLADLETPSAGLLTTAEAQDLQNTYGWEFATYGYGPAGNQLGPGENNYGGDPQITAPVQWDPANTAGGGKAEVISRFQTAKAKLIDYGLPSALHMIAGQPRKLHSDGFDDVTQALFEFNDLPHAQEHANYWPPVDPGVGASGGRYHMATYMHARTSHQNVPISNSSNKLRLAINRAVTNKEWLRFLFHSVDSVTPQDGFSILEQELSDLIDYVHSVGGVFRTDMDVLAGRV